MIGLRRRFQGGELQRMISRDIPGGNMMHRFHRKNLFLYIAGLLLALICLGCSPEKGQDILSKAPTDAKVGEVHKTQLSNTGFQLIAQTPQITSNAFLQCLDENKCWIIEHGKSWKTTDGGKTWDALPKFTEKNDISMGTIYFDSNVGATWYLDGYFVTRDAGLTWEKAPPTPIDFPNGQLRHVLLVGHEGTRFVAGGRYRALREGEGFGPNFLYSPDRKSVLEPALYRSNDGGITWNQIGSPGKIGVIQSLHFIDSIYITMLTDGEIYYSENAGGSWKPARYPARCVKKEYRSDYYEGKPVGLYSLNSQNTWVSFDDGRLAKSNDGGESWCDILNAGVLKFGGGREGFVKLHFIDTQHGWGLGGDLSLYETFDGGKQWKPIPSNIVIYDIEFTPDYGVILAKEGLYRYPLKV
jgi:photosystem II stability/assembly factor-like uncharacterized protein